MDVLNLNQGSLNEAEKQTYFEYELNGLLEPFHLFSLIEPKKVNFS